MAVENRMDKIVALAKRRGFIFQSSEIYGGLNGFWDYGPLGVELKRNVRQAWWSDMITEHDEITAPVGAPTSFDMVGVETSIIMHPQVWKVSGHYDLFADKLVDCRETKARYRFDHLRGRWASHGGNRIFVATDKDAEEGIAFVEQRALKFFGLKKDKLATIEFGTGTHGGLHFNGPPFTAQYTPAAAVPGLRPITETDSFDNVLAPEATKPGSLTDPRDFNLMFQTYTGALQSDENKAFLRPETAQGMFVNFKNVCDSSRVKVPFGVAQIGKSFRNEITPRNFTFRSREFEQMEMEFFCHPGQSLAWYQYWRDRRYSWYIKHGISKDNLILREHAKEELAHYSVGTADLEYAFPFLDVGSYGELEGVAHRGDFDLRSHSEGKLCKQDGNLVVELGPDGKPKYLGSGKDLSYFDDESRERFIPHVIEPAAGCDRATLAFLCEAFHEDKQPDEKGVMQERLVLKLHPKLAPVKVAIFPLIKKDGLPEKAAAIYRAFKQAGIAVQYDQQGAIGRRYRRMDEIGTPYCITIDGETNTADTVTVRDRDTLEQIRVPVTELIDHVQAKLKG